LNLSLRRWGAEQTPDVLLVHGFGDNALVWDRFASALAGRYSLLAIDLRGHGQSSWDPAGTYALADHVADVVQVLEHTCLAPVVLVGHSLGAHIAVRAAAARRNLVSALVAVDCALWPNRLSAGHVRRKFRERQRDYESVAEYVSVLQEQLPLAQPELLMTLAEGALRVNDAGRCEERSDPLLVNMDDTIDTEATIDAFRQVGRPILLVRGEGSAVLSRAAAVDLLSRVPQSRVGVVASAGHTVMLDNPQGFCAVARSYVLRFCARQLGESVAG
jgi:pimeloyl-ACP methyl ester carboxylesterase